MRNFLYRIVLVSVLLFGVEVSFAQDVPQGWHLQDKKEDSCFGISLNKAYRILKEKKRKSTPVIVAVIDSGVDTAHEDLRNILWHNTKEIPGNNKDDDGDGYIDDVYGWNFLGTKEGKDLKKAGDERGRIYYLFKDRFSAKNLDTLHFNALENFQYQSYQRAIKELGVGNDDEQLVMLMEMATKSLKKCDDILKVEMAKEIYTTDDVEKFKPTTNEGKQAKYIFFTVMELIKVDKDVKNTEILHQLDEEVENKKASLTAMTTPPPNYRDEFVHDNYTDIKDKYYGNANVLSVTPMHGTHVTGIIAAQRNNGIGMDGVADNVKVMMLRAVPDGDEYDKDIALAIMYAVNKGAKVINMSFGKSYSPEKNWVDSAVKYAEQKDVLLVHAAGNDGADVDVKENYPSAYFLNHSKAKNFITVGASSDDKIGNGSLVAEFSNYGKETVDVFAPGVKIYSTLPGGNQYGNQRGTSMASPVVAGLAALLREYFPKFSAIEIKNIIMQSVTIPDTSAIIIKPGTADEKVQLKDLCVSGGIINAAKAVELALKKEQESGIKN